MNCNIDRIVIREVNMQGLDDIVYWRLELVTDPDLPRWSLDTFTSEESAIIAGKSFMRFSGLPLFHERPTFTIRIWSHEIAT